MVNKVRRSLVAGALMWPLLGCAPKPPLVETPLGLRTPAVPQGAQRIVSLEFLFTEMLLTTGVAPAGVADPDTYRNWVGIAADGLQQAVSVGTRQQPDIEAIASLRPDLIIGYAQRHRRIAARLAAIAPTVIYDLDPPPGGSDGYSRLMAVFDDLVGLLGIDAGAALVRKGLNTALDTARAHVRATGLEGQPTALFNPLASQAGFWGFNRRSAVGGLLDHIGLTNAWRQLSPRQLGVRFGFDDLFAHPDWMLLVIDQPDAALYHQALWQALPAVRSGHVSFLPRKTWTFGGPVAMTRYIEQVAAALADVGRRQNG